MWKTARATNTVFNINIIKAKTYRGRSFFGGTYTNSEEVLTFDIKNNEKKNLTIECLNDHVKEQGSMYRK